MMKFCSACGAKVELRVPEMDDRERFVCVECETIYYQNPKMVVGCLPIWQDKVLLCKRAIEPRRGYWTLPAGFMENGETMAQGAARETFEEAQAVVTIGQAFRFYDIPHIHQMYGFFLASLDKPEFSSGPESLDVGLFSQDEIPWDELAFPVMTDLLESYFAERKSGEFTIQVSDRYVFKNTLKGE